ncbi:MAG: glycosyltransferase family 39 protein [Chitinivibrionia bacterium]|nr:glycosyltransferase family 39 protein [Chitinivibrionia bacterium]
MNKRQLAALAMLIFCAFAFRMGFCLAVPGIHAEPRGDEIDYLAIAGSIANGGGFCLSNDTPTARRPPLYPLFLSAWFKIFGARIEIGRVVQVLLGTLIVFLVFRLGCAVLSVNTALAAAALTAANPFLIFASAYLLTENLYTVLLLVLLILFTRPAPGVAFPLRTALFGGFLTGLCALCRPTAFLLWAFGTCAIMLFYSGTFAARLRNCAVFIGVLGVTLLPWAYRNHRVFGTWVWFTTHGGITFYQSNNRAVVEIPQYRGGVAPLYALPGYEGLEKLDEITKDEAAWRMGKQFLAENERLVPELVARKFARFWRFRSDAGMSGIKSGWWWNKESAMGRLASGADAGLVYAVFVMPLFLVGLFATVRRYKRLCMWYGTIIVHVVLALVFFGSLRARLPLEPLMALWASAGLAALAYLIRRRAPRHAGHPAESGG